MPRVRHPSVLCLLLAGLVAWLFWPVLKQPFLTLDDPDYVTQNDVVRAGLSLAGLRWALASTAASNWHPLTWLSHMLDCQLYGLQPWGQHLTSLSLHALNTVLVFLVLRNMTRATSRSFIVAALFGLHPLHVESVAWVAERKDVLSTLFCLLTLWAYAAYSRARAKIEAPTPGETCPARDSRRAAAAYVLSLLFFTLGLMSKPMLVTLPFVLLLLDYWPLGRLQFRTQVYPDGPVSGHSALQTYWPLLPEKIPFFLLTAASCAVTFVSQKGGGAVIQNVTLDFRLKNALVAYCRYLGKFVWPSKLAIFYSFPEGGWPMYQVLRAAVLIGGISLLAFLWMRRWPFLPVGWFWFVGTLVPVIGVVQVGGQSLADRYMYIPSIGLFVLLVWVIGDLIRRWQYRIPVASVLAAAAILGCMIATRQELVYWRDGESLFRRSLAVDGPNTVSLSILGEVLNRQKRWDEATPLLQEAIRLSPHYADAWQALGSVRIDEGRLDEAIALFQSEVKADPNDAQAHRDLGATLCQAKRWPEAAVEFAEAIRLRPGYAAAHRGLGLALVHEQRPDEAMSEYLAALRLQPEAHDHSAVAELLIQKGRLDEALNQLREAMAMEPGNATAHLAAGQLLSGTGNTDNAIREYQTALRLDPNLAQAHYLLGGELAERGRPDEAIAQFRAALIAQPEYADAQNDLGMALDARGQSDEAIAHLREAVRLSPDNPETHNNLGASLANAGRLDEAIAQFREALRLKPGHPGAQRNLALVLAAQARGGKN